MDLSYSNLEGANLSGSNLAGINLQGSNLGGANLEQANLQGANLRGANLTGANLARANLRGANLKESILEHSNFYRAQLQEANFYKANMLKVKALWANFENANFYRANLQSANLNRTKLSGADFYKANLEKAELRFADLGAKSNLIGAELRGADLRGARFWRDFLIKQANNWENALLLPNWELQIALNRTPRLRIALLKPKSLQSLFNAYESGMRQVANRRIEIWGIDVEEDVDDEARTILELVEEGMDAIILSPADPVKSLNALQKAQDAGVAIVTVDFCFDPTDAEDLVIACYNTDSYKMGYDSGEYLVDWVSKNLLSNSNPSQQNSGQSVQIALVDGAVYDRYYPYLQGFLKALDESSVSLEIVDAVSVANSDDIEKVVNMLKKESNSEVKLLWGGSNLATELTIKVVKQLGLEDQVEIFGILDLTQEKAEQLFVSNSPVQLIIYQSGIQIGEKAAITAVEVLTGNRPGADYKECVPKHHILTPNDRKKITNMLIKYSNANQTNITSTSRCQ